MAMVQIVRADLYSKNSKSAFASSHGLTAFNPGSHPPAPSVADLTRAGVGRR